MTIALWQTALPASAEPSRWGRTAMASYFVVAATLDMAAHQDSALALLSGAGAALDWFYVLRATLLLASVALFSLGRFTGVIARVWVAYSVLHAFGTHAFWQGTGAAFVLEHAGPFMADIAVAASLLLYLSDGARRAVRRHA